MRLRIIIFCCRFLKLMLGIAVTCPNRQTFISRIGGLDQATQHSLTQSLASFIIIKVRFYNNRWRFHLLYLMKYKFR